MRGLIVGYKVHLACNAETDMPLAFKVAPANENEKRHAATLLNHVAERVGVEAVICDRPDPIDLNLHHHKASKQKNG